jgi:ketosteroid isomerase-like protein
MALDAIDAREILDATYMAWNCGDIDGLLARYTDDLVFSSNVGGADGKPLTIVGKSAFREFIQGIAEVAESTSIIRHFWFRDGIGRAKVDYCLRHKKSELSLAGSYRQVTSFLDGKIARAQQFHDAARMAAFWRLVASEEAAR